MKDKILLLNEVYKLNRDNIEKLKQILHSEKWTLCLGAGVSISAGLPDWYTLLSKMMVRLMCFSISDDPRVEENECGWQYNKAKIELVNVCGKTDLYKNKIRKALEKGDKHVLEGQNTLELAEAVRQFILKDSGDVEMAVFYIKQLVKESCVPSKTIEELKEETLGAITKLIKECGDGSRHIITYNYDNLLEECLRKIGGINPAQIHSYSDNPYGTEYKGESWEIYHVHGCIPVSDDKYEKESENIILTETSYYNAEKIGYSWTNLIQSHRLATSSMIFIGFSGQDYNFRRILKNMEKAQKHQHYILICIDDFVNRAFVDVKPDILEDKNELRENYSFELMLLNQLLHAQYVYWNQYGLTPIWTTIENIPGLIKELSEM